VTGANQVREDRRNRHEEGIPAWGHRDPRGIGESAPTADPGGARGLVATAIEGLLALTVGARLGVVHELMEPEVVRHEALLDRAR